MENLNNVDDRNEKPHPKPSDDPGAQIETVSPDSEKDILPNDQNIPPENTNSDVKDNTAPKSQENNNESKHPEIETVTPDTENEDFSDDQKSTPEEIIDSQETDLEENDTASKNPDKNDEDNTDIETVTP